jgi:drug/metabolite transporter (DMT)-like permease
MYLILCIIINAFIGSIFRYFDRYGIQTFQAVVVNYFVCFAMAGLVSWSNPIPVNLLDKPWLPFAIIIGLSLIVVFNIVGATINTVGVGPATVFQKMALIAPTTLAVFLYGEKTSWILWLGIFTAIGAIIFMSLGQSDLTTQSNKVWILPLLTFLGSCFVDSAFFLIDKKGLAANGDIKFLATLFLIAGCIGWIVVMFKFFYNGEQLLLKNVLGGICLGVPNFFSLYLIILSLQSGIPATWVFPINNVGVLVVAVILGYLLFGERFHRDKIIGFCLAILAIILITMG